MSKPMIRIHNADTGEIIDREMNEVELAQHNSDLDRLQAEKLEIENKAQLKTSLLERLGITEDEANLLLG
jgi:hypothetical protein